MHVVPAQVRFGHMLVLPQVSKREDGQASIALRDLPLGSGKRASQASVLPEPQ